MTDTTHQETHQHLIVTPEGYKKLLEELEHLKAVERKQVANRIREAKQFGDPEGNAEYEEAKAQQGHVEGRILELQRLLQNAVVAEDQGPADQVRVGSLVKLKDASGKQIEYRIVGPVEADPGNHKISYQSPVGQALMGRTKGDKVTVVTPAGTARYTIISVKH